MGNRGTALLVTLGLIAYAGVTAVLLIPFGMAEPGQPHGLGLQGRSAYEASEIVSAVITTAACWTGRYRLRRGPAGSAG